MKKKTIDHFFKEVQDPRHHNSIHKFIDIIIISICAVISGADTYEQIESFGNVRKVWLSRFLELPNGISTQFHGMDRLGVQTNQRQSNCH